MKITSRPWTHLLLVGVIALDVALCLILGCAPKPDPATVKKVQSIANQSALDQAKQSARDHLAAIHGQDSPLTHPIAAANESVKALRPWLILLSIVGVVGWICSFAFATQLPFLSSLSACFRWVAVLSLTALFTLPFLPTGILLMVAAVIGLVIYELVKTKSIPATESALESMAGLAVPELAPAVVAPVHPAAAVAHVAAPAPVMQS